MEMGQIDILKLLPAEPFINNYAKLIYQGLMYIFISLPISLQIEKSLN